MLCPLEIQNDPNMISMDSPHQDHFRISQNIYFIEFYWPDVRWLLEPATVLEVDGWFTIADEEVEGEWGDEDADGTLDGAGITFTAGADDDNEDGVLG